MTSTFEEPLLVSTGDRRNSTNEGKYDEDENLFVNHAAAQVHGIFVGFLTEIMNISGTAYISYRWSSDKNIISPHETFLDTFLHCLVWILSQVDLYLYLFMWAGLTLALTNRGIEYLRGRWYMKGFSARSIFVMGVKFYSGVVIGSFLAWSSVDYFLGMPAPILPMLYVLLFGLFIANTMVWCYDFKDEKKEDEVKNEGEGPLIVRV